MIMEQRFQPTLMYLKKGKVRDPMNIATQTCTEFLEALASKAPVPGGGGASALVGAVGVALGNMVGNLTVGKKKYADVEADVRALDQRSEALRRKLWWPPTRKSLSPSPAPTDCPRIQNSSAPIRSRSWSRL